ncbi:MAG TPA: sugar phosphate isomerase/epimerase [Acidimicrobiales bacterium]|jgi:inosose dehydratase|nr:sugar phosphate isomerase/epimerase [Acidimicrobiales bacterium]
MSACAASVLDRLAGAPISWGVCEVPGWGTTLSRDRVLSEIAALGLRATELGPRGYLGASPEEVAALLGVHGLACVGGFVPLVLHDPGARAALRRDAEDAAQLLAGAGGSYFVTAAVRDAAWSEPLDLDEPGWAALAAGLGIVEEICRDHGLVQVLHPHVGTLVERADQLQNLLGRSSVRICLDTGHLAIGGVDPVAFANEHAARVALVHLKDVDLSRAAGVLAHRTSLLAATRGGLFRRLGAGDLDIGAVVRALEGAGYGGWYVLEQDTVIDAGVAAAADPARDVQASIDYLRGELGTAGG